MKKSSNSNTRIKIAADTNGKVRSLQKWFPLPTIPFTVRLQLQIPEKFFPAYFHRSGTHSRAVSASVASN